LLAHFLFLFEVEATQRAALSSSARFLRLLRQEFQLQERFKFAHEAAYWKDGVPRPPQARRHFVHVSAVWEKLQRPRELQVAREQTHHRHAWRLQVSLSQVPRAVPERHPLPEPHPTSAQVFIIQKQEFKKGSAIFLQFWQLLVLNQNVKRSFDSQI